MATFAEIITAPREETGKKRQETADALGISRASLEYYEKGKRKPDIEILAKFADYYAVSADYLLGRTTARTTDRDLRFVCDYTGLDEETIEHITVKNHIMLPTSHSRLSFYNKIPGFLTYTKNKYFDYYTKSLNDFLQSGCLYDIASACSYEKMLEYCYKEIKAFENSGIKPEELSEYKREKLHMCVDIFKDFYHYRMINLFTVQNSVLDFVKSTTSILQAPNDIDEIKEYADSLWLLDQEISELREAYAEKAIESTFFSYPINDITSIVDCILDNGLLEDYTIEKLLSENDKLSEKEKEDLLTNINRELKERDPNGNHHQTQ